MDDVEGKLRRFIAAADDAALSIHTTTGRKTSYFEIQRALSEVLAVDTLKLIEHHFTAESIVSALKDFDFRVYDYSILLSITLSAEGGVLPAGLPRRLGERTVKHRGERWRVHQNDADPFPSQPHAHNVDTGYSLHLGNGCLFDKRREVARLPKADLERIRELLTNAGVTLPPLDG